MNATLENIGARRLHTVLERIMDEVSFDADVHAANGEFVVTVSGSCVRAHDYMHTITYICVVSFDADVHAANGEFVVTVSGSCVRAHDYMHICSEL